MSAGKTDVYYYSPCGKKFRSKPQIARFLGDHADLTCFDFSRAGSLGDGTRRRARDRNPQGTVKRFDPRHIVPQSVRPLSLNPLRPSGPVRRTCGVIKLPIMLLSPPAGNTELRDSVLGQISNGSGSVGGDSKGHTLNVVVQSLWERRLNTLNPNDHVTGKELSRLDPDPIPPPGYGSCDGLVSSSSSRIPLLLPSGLQPQTPVLPSLLSSVQRPQSHTIGNNNKVNSGTRLLQIHQDQQQQQVKPHPNNIPPRITGGNVLPMTVTDSDVKLQEQRVLLLRQQLMAAQSSL